MATKIKKKKLSPEQKARRTLRKREEERRGLWVVTKSVMKQYGDTKIDGIGQIITRQGLINDGKMLTANYVRPVEIDEDWETCESCGLQFLGSVTAGPYGAHLRRAKHTEGVIDTDNPALSREAKPKHRSDASRSPDSTQEGEWDLEDKGASAPTKLEDEVKSGTIL